MKFIFDLQRFVTSGASINELVKDAYGNWWDTLYNNMDIFLESISTKNTKTNKNLECRITDYTSYENRVYITVGDYTKTITITIYNNLYTNVDFLDSTICTAFWKNQDLIEHIIQDNLGLPFSLVSIKPKNFTLPDVITSTYTTTLDNTTYYIRSFCILGSKDDGNVVNYVAK